AAYTDPIEAQLAAGLLQAEGIPARLDDTGTAIANWEWRLAIGGMRLRVPDAQAMHARRVLAALEAGEYAIDDDALPEVHDGDGCDAPRPHGTHGTQSDGDAPGTGHRADNAAHEAAELQPPDRETLSSRIAWAALM